MAELKEARVPDIGDFDAVPVIELLVSVGDTVKQDQGLVTLESDKATMEVPAPFDGVVREVRVKVGDDIGEGTVVAMIEPAGGEAAQEDAGKGEAKSEAASKADEAAAAKPEEKTAAAETGTQVEPVSTPANPTALPHAKPPVASAASRAPRRSRSTPAS